jgi:uncharacterized protein YjiS (DUF1127 family)
MSSLSIEVNRNQALSGCGGVFLKSDKCVIVDNNLAAQPSSKEKRLHIVNAWIQRSRQRKQLAQLDKHLLDDLGLTKEMVKNEISKPFWK